MIRTTTVGAHPLDRPLATWRWGAAMDARDEWRALLDVPSGRERLEAIAQAQIRDAVKEQDELGLDVVAEGETTRHDYWSYFMLSLAGTVPTNMAPPAHCLGTPAEVTVVGPLTPLHDYMIDDWKTAQSFTRRPVKFTLPGPLTCATYLRNRAYESQEALSLAIARSINDYVRRLSEAGCRYVQIDDCQLAYQPDAAERFGLAHLAVCFEGLGPEVTRILHLCRGTPAFPTVYHGCGKAPDQDCYQALLPLADDMAIDVLSVEQAFFPSPVSMFKDVTVKTIMLGVINVATLAVESPDEIVARARPVLEIIGPERLILAPDCGFFNWNVVHEGRHHRAAVDKLRNMVDAAQHLNAAGR